jgi:hypothetical protein
MAGVGCRVLGRPNQKGGLEIRARYRDRGPDDLIAPEICNGRALDAR